MYDITREHINYKPQAFTPAFAFAFLLLAFEIVSRIKCLYMRTLFDALSLAVIETPQRVFETPPALMPTHQSLAVIETPLMPINRNPIDGSIDASRAILSPVAREGK